MINFLQNAEDTKKTALNHSNSLCTESKASSTASSATEGLIFSRPKKKGRKRVIGGLPVCSTLEDWARRLGVKLYKELSYPCLDPKYMNSSRSMRLSADRFSICGTKGWSSILSNVCADHGSWYFEVLVNPHDKAWDEAKIFGWEICKNFKGAAEALPHLKEKLLPSLRIGWGTRLMKWGAPVGANQFGYAISQKTGNLVHNGCVCPPPNEIFVSTTLLPCVSSLPSCLLSSPSSTCSQTLSSSFSSSTLPICSSCSSVAPTSAGLHETATFSYSSQEDPCFTSSSALPASSFSSLSFSSSSPSFSSSSSSSSCSSSSSSSSFSSSCSSSSFSSSFSASSSFFSAPDSCSSPCSSLSMAKPSVTNTATSFPITLPLPAGTIIGCYLHLPAEKPLWILPDPRMEEKLWAFLKLGLLCNTTNEGTLPPRIPFPESYIKFSINGILLDSYFKDIYCAEYHPCISCFNMGSATLNLGPHFHYPPTDSFFKPACEMSPSRYPCKADLIKCWTYSDEVEETWTEEGTKFLRKKTVAEVEGLYKRQTNSLSEENK